MKKNVASQSIGAQMITAADGTAFTGTVSVLYTLDNGTQTSGGGTAPVHEGNGYHSYTPLQSETNADHIAFTFTGTGAIPATIQMFTEFPQSVDNNTAITALNDFNPASDTVANVTLVATTTTNTDMRGTDSANTVVPASLAQFNARSLLSVNYALEVSLQTVDVNVDSILVDTGTTIPAQITALNDFNPASDTVANVTLVATTTTNTDMAGTNNALLAASYTAPDNAGITQIQTDISNVPTVTEFNARTLPSADYSQFDYTTNEVSADTVKVNGASVFGNGTSANLWRG